jgi:hypothetical protein
MTGAAWIWQSGAARLSWLRKETVGLADVGSQRPGSVVLQQRDVVRGLRGQQRLGVGQVADRDMDVVLQVLADRQVGAWLDAVGLQLGRDTDAGQHQQLR